MTHQDHSYYNQQITTTARTIRIKLSMKKMISATLAAANPVIIMTISEKVKLHTQIKIVTHNKEIGDS